MGQALADGFIAEPERFSRLYADVITFRQMEVSHLLRALPAAGAIRRHGVFLMGSSEAAIAIAAFRDDPAARHRLINGRAAHGLLIILHLCPLAASSSCVAWPAHSFPPCLLIVHLYTLAASSLPHPSPCLATCSRTA